MIESESHLTLQADFNKKIGEYNKKWDIEAAQLRLKKQDEYVRPHWVRPKDAYIISFYPQSGNPIY